MQKFLGGTTLQPLEKRRDTELTLGPTTLVLLGLGLFALCGVCFVFGYAMGQHGAPVAPAAAASLSRTNSGGTAQSPANPSKPAPSQSSFQPRADAAPPAIQTLNEKPAVPADSSVPRQSAPPPVQKAPSTPPVPTPAEPAPAASPVHSAFAGQPGTPASAGSGAVRPALAQSTAPAGIQPGTWMVQIAAVSHPEDAEVLVSALRKHSYAVAVHRDPLDSLIHVQVGPFASRNDAAAMRQKLLNDGYNAIVQP